MELVERFLKHGLYLRGWQPRTVKTYRQALVQIPASDEAGSRCLGRRDALTRRDCGRMQHVHPFREQLPLLAEGGGTPCLTEGEASSQSNEANSAVLGYGAQKASDAQA